LPPAGDRPGIVYFCEVQFQKDERLYERLFGESLLYFYRQRDHFCDWQAVVIYPSRNMEQSDCYPYRSLLNGEQMHRVYLDELGNIGQLSIGLGLLVLTTLSEAQAPAAARSLLERVSQDSSDTQGSRGIIELITTIMVYRFAELSRVEIEAMLGLRLQESRVYQEAKAEGQQIGEQIGEQRGRQAEGQSLVLRLLTRQVGELPESVKLRVQGLSLEQLESLGEALLDFTTWADLTSWLQSERN
jgi:predicted transposase/invertase (TIGR01784 family)